VNVDASRYLPPGSTWKAAMNDVVSPERAVTSKISAPAVGLHSRGATVKSKPFLSPGPRETTVFALSGSRKNLMS
jgi:hypothetical protein